MKYKFNDAIQKPFSATFVGALLCKSWGEVSFLVINTDGHKTKPGDRPTHRKTESYYLEPQVESILRHNPEVYSEECLREDLSCLSSPHSRSKQ